MKLIDGDESYSDAILEIWNHAIATSTALYENNPRTIEFARDWFSTKRDANYPILCVVDEANCLMGFGSYGPFRTNPGYRYTVEHSIYVHPKFQRRGVGKLLLTTLIERAEQQNYHVLVGAIDGQNESSIRLHEHFGFERTAYLPQVGFKFGRWLDVVMYQKILATPLEPV
jgi:L-amino acid N-acyltransferase